LRLGLAILRSKAFLALADYNRWLSRKMASPTPQPAGPESARRPQLFMQLQGFWQRVTEGLEIGQLWKQFHADARSSYRLYSRDFHARAPQEGRRHNFFHTAQEFAWAILEKLTPARRVLLLLGVVLLIFPAGGFSYHGKAGEVEVVEFDFRFYGGVALFVLLMLEIADRVVMKRDLEIARDIQRWLLPATPPQVPGIAIAFATSPANTVAGDYYDVFARPASAAGEARFLLSVADVAGKSIPAALLMATFQASLRTLSATPCSLEEMVVGMNQYACTNSQSGLRFTTAFLAEFDPATGRLDYINAGHNNPILRRRSGAVEYLVDGGLPLGIRAEAGYQSGSVVLEEGDWLVIFTDGLVEALDERGEEYGEPRLLEVLRAGAASEPDELLRRMLSEVAAFVGSTPQHDDITCVLVKVSG
jgi:sigma-B regulation protein RsbU (phosphoserine phosphatase)